MRSLREGHLAGGLFVGAMGIASVFNLAFNAYLGRVLTATDFGVVSLLLALVLFFSVPFAALQSTVNHRGAFLEARYGSTFARASLRRVDRATVAVGAVTCIGWLLATPLLTQYFRLDSAWPIALFGLVPLTGFTLATNRGVLSGRLQFASLGLVILTDPALRLVIALVVVIVGLPVLVPAAIPLSIVGACGLSLVLVRVLPSAGSAEVPTHQKQQLPWRFFGSALLSNLSAMAFPTLDVLLAKHFLAPVLAGEYALISLLGKLVYFLGTLANELVVSLVSRADGESRSTARIMRNALAFAAVCMAPAVIACGPAARFTATTLFGAQGAAAVDGAPWIAAGAACFAISRSLVNYHMARREHLYTVAAAMLVAAQLIFIGARHGSPTEIAQAMAACGAFNLIVIALLHLSTGTAELESLVSKVARAGGRLLARPSRPSEEAALRVLILNWRDTRHKWAGGAEVYVHELARRWARAGVDVTLFCGNDRYCPPEEIVDGVKVVRRGGFFTVYLWALIYYLWRFRGQFDVILDCENGVPFFSPLYANTPVVLLLFHVHQDVFVEHLRRPLSDVARFLEGEAMPRVYDGHPAITISNSSKSEICAHGFFRGENVDIVNPGVDSRLFATNVPKARHPQFLYLGRLRAYKNVDVAIRALALVRKRHPDARLIVAGDGESRCNLMRLATDLGVEESVEFTGKVSEQEKACLLAASWAALQPSMVEGWGITVIEANACGTPVIAHDVSGLRDAVVDGQTGCLVEPMNVEQFASVMSRLVEDAGYRHRLEAAAIAWARRFDWDRSAAMFGEILAAQAKRERKQVQVAIRVRTPIAMLEVEPVVPLGTPLPVEVRWTEPIHSPDVPQPQEQYGSDPWR